MWLNNVQGYGADILLSIFAVYLFVYYFDIFFYGKNDKRLFRVGLAVFAHGSLEYQQSSVCRYM